MTDPALARALHEVSTITVAVRQYWAGASALERDRALATMRQSAALQRSLEQWIAARAVRAATEG